MGKRHRPESVISGRAIRPAISYGKPGATHAHPMTRIGTTPTNLDLFPNHSYFFLYLFSIKIISLRIKRGKSSRKLVISGSVHVDTAFDDLTLTYYWWGSV
ncbi:MAG TPA: hypothetical protein VHT72_05410 [Puia sp.]|nr:hypothetical protein [Puia sp.]